RRPRPAVLPGRRPVPHDAGDADRATGAAARLPTTDDRRSTTDDRRSTILDPQSSILQFLRAARFGRSERVRAVLDSGDDVGTEEVRPLCAADLAGDRGAGCRGPYIDFRF